LLLLLLFLLNKSLFLRFELTLNIKMDQNDPLFWQKGHFGSSTKAKWIKNGPSPFDQSNGGLYPVLCLTKVAHMSDRVNPINREMPLLPPRQGTEKKSELCLNAYHTTWHAENHKRSNAWYQLAGLLLVLTALFCFAGGRQRFDNSIENRHSDRSGEIIDAIHHGIPVGTTADFDILTNEELKKSKDTMKELFMTARACQRRIGARATKYQTEMQGGTYQKMPTDNAATIVKCVAFLLVLLAIKNAGGFSSQRDNRHTCHQLNDTGGRCCAPIAAIEAPQLNQERRRF
jgi:hypothetical protein